MVTQTFGISDRPGRGTTRRTRDDGQPLRHRLDVFAADTGDVVQTTGGWLFDRVMAGWEVNVLLPRGCAARPLQVLGVQVLDLGAEFDTRDGQTQGLAVSCEAFNADERVRDRVRDALDKRLIDVALWGENWPLGMTRGLRRVEYTLSAAARAFKGQALHAAGIGYSSVDSVEALVTDSAWLG
ncbi:hypothetical protein H0P51_02140 [Mycobacterium vicinigordonae]|uniref:Uncharacterized protein n=2 Tax=Mycobacterium vicinigordonae TaxID=1719132 RepID=A0A7D6I133_9MYCO|nr:hypothetical protein H0P51_02140 [Mycobacterium vicinigordonae]